MADSREVRHCIAPQLLSLVSALEQLGQASFPLPKTALPIFRATLPRFRLFLPLVASVLLASFSTIAVPTEAISLLSQVRDAVSPESRQACAPTLPTHAPLLLPLH